MNELRPSVIPPAFGLAAWRGTVLAGTSPVADRLIAAPEPTNKLTPIRVRAVRVTEFSVGNRQRLPVVGVLREYWRFMKRMSGEYLVVRSDQFHRLPNRRMARPPSFRKVIPNRRNVYVAPQYGPAQGG